MSGRLMTLRYPSTCSCGAHLPRWTKAWHEAETKTVTCEDCVAERSSSAPDEASPGTTSAVAPESGSPEVGEPTVANCDTGRGGGAARREYERRRANDDAKLAERHAFWRAANRFFYPDGKQTTHAWKVGAEGEERLARVLEELMEAGVGYPLHDRRMPRSRGNIDHLFVGPSGVLVIDAKNFKGKDISIDHVGGLFSPRVEFLRVDGRERKGLLDGVLKQAEAVRVALSDSEFADCPVMPVLCFIDGYLPIRKSKRVAQGVQLITLKGAREYVSQSGPLDADTIFALATDLNLRLTSLPR